MAGRVIGTLRALIAPAPLFCLAIGFGSGALAMMPLGLRVSDAVAGLMGAIVGALAGVASALALVHYQVFLQARNIAEFIHGSLLEVALGCNSFEKSWISSTEASTGRTASEWNRMEFACISLTNGIERARGKMKRIEPTMPSLPASTALMYTRIEDALGSLELSLAASREAAAEGGKVGTMASGYLGRTKTDIAVFRLFANSMAGAHGIASLPTKTMEEFTGQRSE